MIDILKDSTYFFFLSQEKVSDDEFQTEDQEEEDMEDTIEEQEKHERNQSHLEEISELEKEGMCYWLYFTNTVAF